MFGTTITIISAEGKYGGRNSGTNYRDLIVTKVADIINYNQYIMIINLLSVAIQV